MIVKATIDNREIYLEQQEDGSWEQMSSAPVYAGEYPITVTIIADNGTITIVGSDDHELGKILKLIVLGKSIAALRMKKYLPEYLRKSQVVDAIVESCGNEVDRLIDKRHKVIDSTYIMFASENRIKQWERKLKIIPTGTLEQRKIFLLSILNGQGKLNEEKIKTVVKVFTGGDAIVTFYNSALEVKVLPPKSGEIYLFPDVHRSLSSRVPAHIGLSVQRWYSTWDDIKKNFSDWDTVKNMSDWNAVKNYIPPQ